MVLDWGVVARMTVLTARAGEKVLYALRVRSYAHLQRLGLDYYERELSGRIMTRMTTDVDALSTFLQTGLATAVISVLTVVGVSAALLITDARLALVVLAVLPALLVATLVFRRVSSVAYATSRERISIVNADFQENVAGLRAAQAYRREEFAARRFAERAESYRQARMRSQLAISIYFPGVAMLSDLALAAVVYFGALEVAAGTTSAGTLVAFVLYLGLLFGPIQQLSQVFDGYQQARVGLHRIADLLATPSSIETVHAEATVPIVGRLRGEVDLDDVRFRYGGASEDALADIRLHIPAGSTVALVGRTGAGKSTIVKLLARFYDPSDGAVRVDGVDLRRYDLPRYRAGSGSCRRRRTYSQGTWRATSRSAARPRRAPRSRPPPERSGRSRRSQLCRAGCASPSASGAKASRRGSASSWRWPARSSCSPTSCCSTRRPPPSTPPPSGSCSTRAARSPAAAPASLSPIA